MGNYLSQHAGSDGQCRTAARLVRVSGSTDYYSLRKISAAIFCALAPESPRCLTRTLVTALTGWPACPLMHACNRAGKTYYQIPLYGTTISGLNHQLTAQYSTTAQPQCQDRTCDPSTFPGHALKQHKLHRTRLANQRCKHDTAPPSPRTLYRRVGVCASGRTCCGTGDARREASQPACRQ